MYGRKLAKPLYRAVMELEWRALSEWRNTRVPGYSVTDATGLGAEWVHTGVNRLPGGRVTVTISVGERRRSNVEIYFFSLQRTGFFGYKEVSKV